MRVSSLLLIAGSIMVLTVTNALSPAREADQVSIAKPLDASRDSNMVLRRLTAVNEGDNNDLGEERGGFKSLSKLFKSSSKTKKAAQAALTGKSSKKAALAAEKQKNFQMYGKILEYDHILYPAMKTWRSEGTSATRIYNEMVTAGRTVDEAETVFKRFSNYLQETMHIVKTPKELEISQMRQMFKDIAKSDDELYKNMALWRMDDLSAQTIYTRMTTIGGRPVGEATTVAKRCTIF